jgi:hypothetical protein
MDGRYMTKLYVQRSKTVCQKQESKKQMASQMGHARFVGQ